MKENEDIPTIESVPAEDGIRIMESSCRSFSISCEDCDHIFAATLRLENLKEGKKEAKKHVRKNPEHTVQMNFDYEGYVTKFDVQKG